MSEFKEELAADVIDSNGLTHKDNKFLEVLFDECKGNIKEAMKLAGLTGPQSLVTKRLGKQIKDISSDFFVANTAKATIAMIEVHDNPNLPGNKNIITAADKILDRGGIVKKEETVIQEQNFMFILPPKESDNE